jgi:hypothetical protein
MEHMHSAMNYMHEAQNHASSAHSILSGMHGFSDRRLKENIEPLAGALGRLLALRGVTFEWKNPARGHGTQTGFIAQEVSEVFPGWVGEREGYNVVALPPMHLAALQIEALRELTTETRAATARTSALEERLDRLDPGAGR